MRRRKAVDPLPIAAAGTNPNAVKQGVRKALEWADVIIKMSRDNPPTC